MSVASAAKPEPSRTTGRGFAADVIVVALAILVAAGAWAASVWHGREQVANKRSEVAAEAAGEAARLSLAITKRVALARGLRALMEARIAEQGPGETTADGIALLARQGDLDAYATYLRRDVAGIRNLSVAPGFVIHYIHPRLGNERVLGNDLLADRRPGFAQAVQQSIDSRSTVLQGPFTLIQGGHGLIVRDVIMAGEAIWGAVGVVADLEPVLADAGLTTPADNRLLAITGTDGQVFFGDGSVLAGDPVVQPLPIPGGSWAIHMAPRHGWAAAARGQIFAGHLAASLVSLLVLALAALIVSEQWRLRDTVAARTSELLASRNEAEAARTRLVAAIDALPDGFSILDSAGRPVIANARNLGTADQEGRHIAPGHVAEVALPDGRWVRVARQETGAGEVVSIETDITELKRREAELSVLKEQAEAANEAKTLFLANISHEIRTPLNAVAGALELLTAEVPDPARQPIVRMGRDAAQTLLALIGDLLDLSRLEAGQLKVTPEPVDLRELMEGTLRFMQAGATDRGLRLSHTVDAGLPPLLLLDPVRIRQILLNLAGNAVKFTERGGVTVRALWHARGDGDGRLELVVEDTGIGIPPDKLPLLFKRFSQVDPSLRRRHGGTGLGLAICHDLVGLMGGRITVESEPGRGSLFRVDIPVTLAAETVSPDGSDTGPAAAALRILAVDDQSVNRMIVSAMLREKGYHCDVAAGAVEAVARVADGGYDLVLMDIHMPQVDGEEGLRRIRALPPPINGVPVVALTADAMPGRREHFLARGFTGFLPKPVSIKALEREIRRLFGHEESTAPCAPCRPANPALAMGGECDLPRVDLGRLMEVRTTVGGGNLGAVLDLFPLELEAQIRIARDAAVQENMRAIHEAAHTIKGMADNLGALRLRHLADRVCHETRSLEQATLALDHLEQEATATVAEIGDLRPRLELAA